MTADLVSWFRAVLDDRERIALATFSNDDRLSGRWANTMQPSGSWAVSDAVSGMTIVYDEGAPAPAEVEHIVRHDPFRVLQEVAAIRQLLDLHRVETLTWVDDEARVEYACIECSGDPDDLKWGPVPGCATVRILAAVHADQPGYDEGWKPS